MFMVTTVLVAEVSSKMSTRMQMTITDGNNIV